VRDEAEPEELPDYSPLRSCERQDGALQELFTLFCLYVQKSVFILLLFFWHAKPGQLGQKN
jgi:hypothetical protein